MSYPICLVWPADAQGEADCRAAEAQISNNCGGKWADVLARATDGCWWIEKPKEPHTEAYMAGVLPGYVEEEFSPDWLPPVEA